MRATKRYPWKNEPGLCDFCRQEVLDLGAHVKNCPEYIAWGLHPTKWVRLYWQLSGSAYLSIYRFAGIPDPQDPLRIKIVQTEDLDKADLSKPWDCHKLGVGCYNSAQALMKRLTQQVALQSKKTYGAYPMLCVVARGGATYPRVNDMLSLVTAQHTNRLLLFPNETIDVPPITL